MGNWGSVYYDGEAWEYADGDMKNELWLGQIKLYSLMYIQERVLFNLVYAEEKTNHKLIMALLKYSKMNLREEFIGVQQTNIILT